MSTVIVKESGAWAKMPFTPVVEPNVEKKRFLQAAKECNAISVKEFTDELRRQIDEYFDNHA